MLYLNVCQLQHAEGHNISMFDVDWETLSSQLRPAVLLCRWYFPHPLHVYEGSVCR